MQAIERKASLRCLSRRYCRISIRNSYCFTAFFLFLAEDIFANDFEFPSPVVSATREAELQKLFSDRRLAFSGGADGIPTEEENSDDVALKPRSKSLLSAPFLMNEAAKEKASAIVDETIPDTDSNKEEIEKQPNLVGGALVNDMQTTAVTPVYKDTVAPMTARLLTDLRADDSDEAHAIDERQHGSSSDLAKLWWVNVRAQQLSDSPENDTGATTRDESSDDEDSQVDGESQAEEESQTEEETEATIESETAAIEAAQDPSPLHVETHAETDEENLVLGTNETIQAELDDSIIIKAQAKDVGKSDPVDMETSQPSGDFVSSGLWIPIDNLLTLGLASRYESLKVSRNLRDFRKLSARLTGLHGMLSGKPHLQHPERMSASDESSEESAISQKRVEAIEKAREGLERTSPVRTRRRIPFFRRRGQRVRARALDQNEEVGQDASTQREGPADRKREERIREERVKQIDRLIAEGQARLQQLICEKDVLQRRPNPLFNYTTASSETRNLADDISETLNATFGVQNSRLFKFPPTDLVEEYLEMMFWSKRLTRMNHTYLWKDSDIDEDDEEERIGDDLLTPSAEAHKLYQDSERRQKDGDIRQKAKKNGRLKNGGGGSWLLRQSLGKGPSLGEKIGEAAETATYRAVAGAVMSCLARALSSLHGINVMKHTDIRLMLEQAPDLPPMTLPGSSNNYAQEAIKTAIRKKSRKGKKRQKQGSSDGSYVQRDAVTEMLLSHVQISAPLLKLFPLGWQRALLGNIITLSTSVVSDFCEGLQFQILGYRLSFSFKPITEEDMINHLGLAGSGFNHRRAKPEDFEAAVKATANDISEELKFLDRWHERALGSGVLRTQIANLIARIVLTLTDEVLSGARMDLWSAHAGGPRMIAGLEYRTQPN